METLSALRARHPSFIYKSYAYRFHKRDLHISFHFFVAPDINFRPTLAIKNVPNRVGEDALNNFVFHLGIIEIPSYWKATCSPTIIVEAGSLSAEQLRWWKDLFMQGMGEFFFRNRIDYTKKDFLSLRSASSLNHHLYKGKLSDQILLPLGGGKDAIVSLEILKKSKKKIVPFVLNPSVVHKKILSLAGYKNAVFAERTIDPKLLHLNKKGYLNGHTPFSAYLAFLSSLIAVLFDMKYIMVSNERSSNEGNARYKGRVINHQYSKTYEFERKFRSYATKYLVSSLEYLSFMRPLYELQIAKLFSRYPKYFRAFLSCNEAQKTYLQKPTLQWCGKCAKCLFVFIALYPFIKEKQLVSIFKKNLFEDPMLVSLLEELTGVREVKPFECVGTKKESMAALFLSLQKHKGKLPILMKYFRNTILPAHPRLSAESEFILKSWNRSHSIPRFLEALLKKVLKTK
ncbi:MAG: hypothetical protein Q7S63_02390 [bacterium]|nr:hypothetical protein [bacterium]